MTGFILGAMVVLVLWLISSITKEESYLPYEQWERMHVHYPHDAHVCLDIQRLQRDVADIRQLIKYNNYK